MTDDTTSTEAVEVYVRPRPLTCRAIRVTSSNMAAAAALLGERAAVITGPAGPWLEIRPSGVALPGDWVVATPDGRAETLTDDEYHATYERITR